MEFDAHELSTAVVSYLARGRSPSPLRDRERLIEEFGPERGEALEGAVDELIAETDAFTFDWTAHSLVSAGEILESTMRERHPELSDDAIRALGWRFTYDWK